MSSVHSQKSTGHHLAPNLLILRDSDSTSPPTPARGGAGHEGRAVHGALRAPAGIGPVGPPSIAGGAQGVVVALPDLRIGTSHERLCGGRHGLSRPSACRENPPHPSECCLREAPMQPRPCFHLTSWSESHRFAGPVARWFWGSGTSVMGLRAESPPNERNAGGRT